MLQASTIARSIGKWGTSITQGTAGSYMCLCKGKILAIFVQKVQISIGLIEAKVGNMSDGAGKLEAQRR